jgi:predicted butyrate kinase (DUF1464 family)
LKLFLEQYPAVVVQWAVVREVVAAQWAVVREVVAVVVQQVAPVVVVVVVDREVVVQRVALVVVALSQQRVVVVQAVVEVAGHACPACHARESGALHTMFLLIHLHFRPSEVVDLPAVLVDPRHPVAVVVRVAVAVEVEDFLAP